MNVELDDLYTIIGQLYVTVHALNERVKELTPKPTENESSIPSLIHSNGA